jgi:DNA-binding NtrC family response regulator
MPARVVLVNDDLQFVEEVSAALWDAGYDVAAFSDSMTALLALEAAQNVELLITRIEYQSGPNGVSLALVTKRKRPALKVLFTALPETEQYAKGVGEFMPLPVDIPDLLETVSRMLAPDPPAAMEAQVKPNLAQFAHPGVSGCRGGDVDDEYHN